MQVGPVADVGVLGGGTAFPARILTNAQVLALLPPQAWGRRHVTDPEEVAFLARGMEETLGVRERAWSHVVGTPLDHAQEESTLDLAVTAARAALADAGVSATNLSMVLCATSTPHRMTATLSAGVGAALGAQAACLDTRTGCAAGIFSLATGALFHAASGGTVLVVAADTFSRVIPEQSKVAALSLADGAAAVVLGHRPGAALGSAFLESDGTLGRLITTDGPLPPTHAEIDRGGYVLSGAPDDLTREIPGKYLRAIHAALARAGVGGNDIDLYVPHQTSREVMETVRQAAGIPAGRMFVNLDKHANVGAAGWLAALVEARALGRCPPGTRVLVASVGGGMSWGAAVLQC